MRLAIILLVATPFLLTACTETPRCVERGTRTALECNAEKVPVCGSDPALIYSRTGALLPVPPDSVESGSCEGIEGSCRPRPVCAQGPGGPATCANGAGAICVLGAVTTVTAPRDSGTAPPDSGPAEQDAGQDAGPGETDAGADGG